MKKLLIVEDDAGIRSQLKWAFAEEYKVLTAAHRRDALEMVKKEKPDVVALDLGLPPDEDGASEGMACLQEIVRAWPFIKVIVVTGNEDRSNALKAVELGAYDFYQKPLNTDVLKVIIQRAIHLSEIERENERLRRDVRAAFSFENMVGSCQAMQVVFATIRKVAATDVTILITGESGTGKELVASAIHYRSPRKDHSLIVINCGAIPENLLESELFGYERGAFTDAKARKIGLIEKASGGTLFLDEIGELPQPLQVKLLRVIQDRKIQRVGGTEPIDVDIRIVAATNRNLDEMVRRGQFREDLFYRLSVIQIQLPPLRERDDDMIILARGFLSRFASETRKRVRGFSEEALSAIKMYDWPGNVRELENRVQRAVIMSDGGTIYPNDLTIPAVQNPGLGEDAKELTLTKIKTLKDARSAAEFEVVRRALLENNWNVSRAAEELEISRPTLHALINKFDLKETHSD